MQKKKPSGRKKKLSTQKKTLSKVTAPKVHPFPVVAIGASAGGLDAVTALLQNLPANTGMAFIYVQHLNRDHKSFLTSILSKITKMKVQEIEDMELMKPDNLYIIPNDKGIEVTDGHIKLIPRSKSIPAGSIDILFTSLAETHKQNVIGVVLSGYAHDGTQGLKAIKEAGGITIAQNNSAQAASMPESAIESGMVDFVLSPKEIAQKLVHFSKRGAMKHFSEQRRIESGIEDNNPGLKTIFEILRKEKGVDFSHYKSSSFKRRIKLSMLHSETPTVKEYVKLLIKKRSEVEILYKNLLINVTGFFRDTEIFRQLKTTFLPKLLKKKTAGKEFRVWVPACSTGEEAYSIAMLLTELQDNITKKIPIKVFASDISEQVIRDARVGEFSESEMKSVSNERLKRFFTKSGNRYTVVKELRNICVFAPHNILNDPPFFRIDFVSCRNLLIYFDEAAQKKALAALHFSLNEEGYLMLGKSETTGTQSKIFTEVSNKFKVYSRKINSDARRLPELIPLFSGTSTHKKSIKLPSPVNISVSTSELDSIIDSTLLTNHMPACAIINQDMNILQFRGSTSLYLAHPSGKATLNILKMARPEFTYELRNAIHKVIKTNKPVRQSGIKLNPDIIGADSDYYSDQLVTLDVSPLKIEEGVFLLLVVFTPQEQTEKYISTGKAKKNQTVQKDQRIKKLTVELNSAHTEMQAMLEAHDKAFEELQISNEEIVSTNEEFQTLNEELETSKEEIEATNEELLSTNRELHMRNGLLTESYDYSEAIIATVHEPMIILDSNLFVKSANKSFYKKFRVTKEYTEGRPLFELGDKEWEIPKLRAALNNILSKNSHFENFEVTQIFPVIGEKVMLLNASRIIQKTHREKLILLAIEDITEKKTAEEKVKASEKNYRHLIQSLPIALYTCDKNGLVESYNRAAVELWGREPEIGQEHWCGSWKIFNTDGSPVSSDTCPMALAIKEQRSITGAELIVERPDGSLRNVLPHPQPVFDNNKKLTGAINTLIDITDIRKSQQSLIDSEKRYNMMLMKSPFAFSVLKEKDMIITLANDTIKEIWGKGKNIEGKPLLHVLPEIKDQQFPALLEKVYATGIPFYGYVILARIKRKGKMEDVYFNLVYQPYLEVDETISGVTIIAYDVTAQVAIKKEAEKQIEKERDHQKKNISIHQESKLELEKLVRRRTRQLERQNVELETANKDLTAFTYISSHDLQEPLRKIKNFTTVLLLEEKKKLSPSGKKYLQKTHETAKLMQLLIEDLLTYSRAKDIDRVFEKTDLNVILDEVKRDIQEVIKAKKATIKFANLTEANIIRLQFRQLMQNLISNSLKFSIPGGPAPYILIKSEIKSGDNLDNENLSSKTDYCHITYTDNGIGFDEQYNERIFEVFQRLHSKEEYPGTGMGLAICKRIVENHNGVISATGKLNKGAQFDIYIPV